MSGPSPLPITAPAATGSWLPPAASSLPAPSLSGMGRQAHIRSANDFCLYLPPDPTTQNLVEAEADAVAYCINAVNGTRPMPDGFLQSAVYLQTPNYVQVTGTFDPLVMNINPADCGGEYDSHGAAGIGNPAGAFIDNGSKDWFQFLGSCDYGQGVASAFVIRSCVGANSYGYCDNK